jgi:hypothetical protein
VPTDNLTVLVQNRPTLPIVSATGSCPETEVNGPFQSHPLWLIPNERSRATKKCPALRLAPREAQIVAVGSHPYLPFMSAAVWISERNEIIAGAMSDHADIGREVLIRIWSLDAPGINRAAIFRAQDEQSVAVTQFGPWDGRAVGGVILIPLCLPGGEC